MGVAGSGLWARLELEFRIGLGKPGRVFIWRKVGPARRVNLLIKKGDLARWVILLAEPTFFSHVNGSPSFVTKCRKVGMPSVARVDK